MGAGGSWGRAQPAGPLPKPGFHFMMWWMRNVCSPTPVSPGWGDTVPSTMGSSTTCHRCNSSCVSAPPRRWRVWRRRLWGHSRGSGRAGCLHPWGSRDESSHRHSPSELGESSALRERSAADGWHGTVRAADGLWKALCRLCPQPAPPFGVLIPTPPPTLHPDPCQRVSPSLSPCSLHPKAQQTSLQAPLLPPAHSRAFPTASSPPQPQPPSPRPVPDYHRTSAAEAKGEKGQEGEQDEGLHGASLHGCCAQCSPWSPRDFIGCCDRRQGGAPQPCQGYFQHIRRGREPPGQAAIVVWGELSSPVTGQNPQGGKCGPRPVEIRWWALALPAWQHSFPTRP